MRRAIACLLGGALLAVLLVGQSAAERAELSLQDVTVIERQDGAGRVLFRVGEGLPNGATISRAILEFPVSGVSESRRVGLQVFLIARDWTREGAGWDSGWNTPGGDVHDRLYARAELPEGTGSGEISFDLTGPMKAAREDGVESFGFLLMADRREEGELEEGARQSSSMTPNTSGRD